VGRECWQKGARGARILDSLRCTAQCMESVRSLRAV